MKIFKLAGGALLAASACWGASVTSATVTSTVADRFGDHTVYTGPGSFALGEGSASVSLVPAWTETATADTGTSGFGLGRVQGVYYFRFSGPGGDVIPVSVSAILDTSVSGSSVATAIATSSIAILDDGFNLLESRSLTCNIYLGCGNDHFAGALSFSVNPNREYHISLGIQAYAGSGNFANAVAGSSIAFGAGFQNAGLYTLEISDGVGNADSTVPEPATFWLSGISACAVLLWRRRLRRA